MIRGLRPIFFCCKHTHTHTHTHTHKSCTHTHYTHTDTWCTHMYTRMHKVHYTYNHLPRLLYLSTCYCFHKTKGQDLRWYFIVTSRAPVNIMFVYMYDVCKVQYVIITLNRRIWCHCLYFVFFAVLLCHGLWSNDRRLLHQAMCDRWCCSPARQ